MTIADWALVISILSAITTLASLGWNIWSKFIYPKPKIRVSFQFMNIFSAADTEPILVLSATNMGPVPVTLYSALIVKKVRFGSRFGENALLNPLEDALLKTSRGPFSGGLPKKVEVGEPFSAYFVADHQSLAECACDLIGFNDTFGRFHWAPKRELARVKERIREYRQKLSAGIA